MFHCIGTPHVGSGDRRPIAALVCYDGTPDRSACRRDHVAARRGCAARTTRVRYRSLFFVLLRGDRGVHPAGRLCPRSLRQRRSTTLVCRLHAPAYGRDVAAVPFVADSPAACIATVYA